MNLSDAEILGGYATSLIGLPYIWGGDDAIEGFDCSGLCVELLKSVGVIPPFSDFNAAGLKELLTGREIKEPEFGALAFYGATRTTHVAFCLNNRLMMEAGGGDSMVKTRADAIKENAFVKVRPVKARSDLNGIFMPKYSWKES